MLTDCTFNVAKTKALISCAAAAQLIYAFVFALTKIKLSHDAAHVCKLDAIWYSLKDRESIFAFIMFII